MIDRLGIGSTLRIWAFVATVSHTNPIYGITLVGLMPQSMHFIGKFGGLSGVRRPCGAQRASSTTSGAP